MRSRLVVGVCAIVLVTLLILVSFPGQTQTLPQQSFRVSADSGEVQGPPVPTEHRIDRIEARFPDRSTLRDLLVDHGFTPQQIHRLIEDTREVHDLNRVKAGHRLALEFFGDGRFRKLEYDIDDSSYLTVAASDGRFQALLGEREFEVRRQEMAGRITSSLWNTLVDEGESGQLVMSIHELLQWDVDFTAIQPDDAFKLIFEKLYYKGEFVKYGDIQALQFNHGGRDFNAFQFADPKTGEMKYYDREGKSVKKAFLKVPFHYDYRISSGFSYSRLHPVTRQRRPHLGIDYAAPTGTPVLASASGRVVFAARKGANGNMVKLRHPNGYYTYYLHLSRILVRAGSSVRQGDRIGLVGSTGLSTGPHLDYRIQDREGRFLNPKKYVALPSEAALSPELMEPFSKICDDFLRQLERIPDPPSVFDGTAVAG